VLPLIVREAAVCAGQAVFDRNLAGVRGRVQGFRAARRGPGYPVALNGLLDEGSALAALTSGTRRFGGRRRERGGGNSFEATLLSPLPPRLAVGRGTALFIEGLCSAPAAVRALEVQIEDETHPVMAHGIRAAGGSHDRWWAIVPFRAVERSRTADIRLRATLARGRGGAIDLARL